MLSRLASACAGILFCYGAYWSLRTGYSEYLAQDHSQLAIESAIRWRPDNPEYFSHLAIADPASAASAIRRAVELNPRDAGIWIEYSRIAEERSNFDQAEACLLEAVRLDRTFAPRWLLSEFYFRRRDTEHFWPAMKAALATSYDDVTPLFESCWALTSDGAVVSQAMPDRADVLRQYLDFLVRDRNHLDLAMAIAERLNRKPDPENTPSLLRFCDRLLEERKGLEAQAIWNWLATHGMVPYPALDRKPEQALTNGTFRRPFLEHGFDWRMPAVEGVLASPAGADSFLRLTFSGNQPESCEILSQWVSLAAGRKYRLALQYETSGLEGETGINWRLLDGDGTNLLAESGGVPPSEGTERTLQFLAGPQTHIARLTLDYTRALGTTRISGSISLRRMSLESAE